MPSSKPPLVVIAGPTASGKSALALALAQQIKGVVVNADSAQIYRDLKILSAAPTGEELKWAEHRLYGVQDATLPCSAADWAALAHAGDLRQFTRAAELQSWSAEPVYICGRFSKALPPSLPSTQASERAFERRPVEENRPKLEELDREAQAGSTPGDTTRINRALEVILSTGQTSHIGKSGARAESSRNRASVAGSPSAAQVALHALRRAICAHDRGRRGRRSRGAAGTRT